jgi:hypothetical protein
MPENPVNGASQNGIAKSRKARFSRVTRQGKYVAKRRTGGTGLLAARR